MKMVHNGVEYGMMQAYAEGFELMHKSEFPIELARGRPSLAAGLPWCARGCCELAANAVQGGGQRPRQICAASWATPARAAGRYTDAMALDVPTPVITALAVRALLLARQRRLHGASVLAALRNQFGGHAVERAN